jgi:Fe(3+) dicitrate transport protein
MKYVKRNSFYVRVIASLLSITTVSFPAMAIEDKEEYSDKRAKVMERVTVIGTQDRREEIPGSASIVKKETLDRYQYTDVHRALKEVPGVTVQEEDGHGLRPNISIRGGRSNRSADITLMEDGILTGPAPYAAPEAYYFPQMDRMESLEIIKGTGAIKYGPRTTNGVLNMVTKPIPAKKQADFIAEAGAYETYRTGVTTGSSVENGGIMLNAFHKETQGFKDIDFVGGNSGYNVQDLLGKIRLNANPSAERYQEVEIKLGYYDEISNETYLGLTDADFALTPNRRYGSSQLDEMNAKAWQTALTHYIELTPDVDLTTSIYHNEVDRSWYRLNGVRVGGVRRDIATIFNDPLANSAYINAIKSANTAGGTFIQRDNARTYSAQGVQTTFGVDYALGETKNKIEIGTRFHRDEEDRFQREDNFDMVGGVASLVGTGTQGGAGNRVQSANAWSGFVQNELSWDRWTVTPGIRFERINLKREDYGSSDPTRSGSALAVFENDINVWIPGIGASYAVTDSWKLLGGVHKGFAPPGVPGTAGEAAFSREEESINYELGTRYTRGNWSGELFGFLTDYSNLLGRDTFSSGGGGTGDAFNGGQVEVKGIEATGQYNAAAIAGLSNSYRVPLTMSYTFTTSEFKNSFMSSFEEWGSVKAGDELPYLPRNQLYLAAGLETDEWDVSVSGKFVDEMRTRAGSGAIDPSRRIDAYWTVDMAGEYKVTDTLSAFATIENMLDEEYVAARRPAGARPGMPMTAMAGVKIVLW